MEINHTWTNETKGIESMGEKLKEKMVEKSKITGKKIQKMMGEECEGS